MKALEYYLGAGILGAVCWSFPASSQCLPLESLTKEAAGGHLSLQSLQAYLPTSDWELHQAPTTYWVYVPLDPEAIPPDTPKTRLELRRTNQQAQYDVVYKTTHKACFNEWRASLRHARLKAEPVTCLQCEGERFTAVGYSVTLYNQQQGFAAGKVPYPFVLVVHSLDAAPTSAN